MPVRITFCITELDPGGAERAMVQLIRRLDRSRYEPSVICLAEKGELGETLESLGVPVFTLNARRWKTLLALPRLMILLRRLRPQILHCYLFQANLLGRLAGWMARVPTVFSGVRVAEQRGQWRGRIDRLTHWMVTRYVCVSAGVAEFTRQTGIPARKILVIPNGVEFEKFAAAKPADLTTLGIPASARVLLFVGRLDPQKAPDLLITASLPLLTQFADVHLLLVGDGPLRGELEKQIAAAGLEERIHLAGSRSDVPALMKASQGLVLPSRWEGMPNVILEAMASGLPILCTRVEGVEELIQDEVSGLLIPVDALPELQAGMTRLLGDPEGCRGLADRAQTVAKKELTWERVARMHQELYELADTKIVPNSEDSGE